MNCPVCSEKMKTIERLGVEVEICPGCKGIWLDAGELDKLLALDDGEEAPDAQGEEASHDDQMRSGLDDNCIEHQHSKLEPPAPESEGGTGSVYDPVPDEMPAEYKHQDRSRFRDAARKAGGGGFKPVIPSAGRAQRDRGSGKGQSAAMRSILESLRKGGAG